MRWKANQHISSWGSKVMLASLASVLEPEENMEIDLPRKRVMDHQSHRLHLNSIHLLKLPILEYTR